MPRSSASIDRAPFGSAAFHSISSAVVLPILAAVPLVVVLLAVRRATGSLVHPLPAVGLIACALLLGIWAVAAHLWLASCGTDGQYRADGRIWQNQSLWLTPTVLVLGCYGLLLPGSPLVGIAGFVALLVAAEAAAWKLLERYRRSVRRHEAQGPIAARPVTRPDRDSANLESDAGEVVIAETTRHRATGGLETIRGWVQAELAAGQRSVPVHVAFCPALDGLPSCEAEQVDGPPATIRVAQVLPYGARFDVKLDVPAARPVSVRIEFAATAADCE